ncbi:sensor histidine kinase [Pseudoxanthomonas daejeonensis]|uniref:histidine kinase n=1 Tax=Pseudoxanthomonas daejeonensis TaxID=266062 RepID=A0ABQ6Z7S1_9GAMM|nr:HAMP domain-containing sensor histidine kinase [Pseudoxanthomonas daejeonensis]KAF1695093.1 hypothetical protein CSC65_07720 [Pseudoxanthomonas daejeonensis]
MARRRSLQRALARRWMAFAAVLSLSFAGSALLLLFLLEDSFIDRHLRAVSATVVDVAGASATLPANFQALPGPALPEDIATRISGKKPGTVIEFRRDDGRYVHVLSARTATGQPFALVYDVTGELTVNPRLPGGLAYALALLALSLLCAYVLAWAFVTRTVRRARALLGEVLASPDPRSLEALAQREPIREFGELLHLHAGVWREQQAAVERERETLAFLAHELRTPLQSARTSLALLDESPAHAPALARLQRAVERLTRASNAILWLASDAAIPAGRTLAAAHLEALVEEFRPLARARGQSIELRLVPGLSWDAPWEAVEALLANLLLNAIQHGGEGVIEIDAGVEALTLRNPDEAAASAGFGLGLRIVQRLAARLGWRVVLQQQQGMASCEVRWLPGVVSN